MVKPSVLRFTKMHSLGNDFIITHNLCNPLILSSLQIKQLAHRHIGVGFDQFMWIEAADCTEYDFKCRIINADGTEVGQCGNGLRCVGAYIHHHQLSDKTQITLKTYTQIVNVWQNVSEHSSYTVAMGQPFFSLDKKAQKIGVPLTVESAGKKISGYYVWIGNPHFIILEPYDAKQIPGIGASISANAFFVEGVNVSFVTSITPQQFSLRVIERGVGETMACGSAACAAMAVLHQLQLITAIVEVHLPGGVLKVAWPEIGKEIVLTGPCHTVYHGILSEDFYKV